MVYYKTYYKGLDIEYKVFFKDKKHTIIHREAAPAVECKNGRKEWWVNGKLHREDGPAIESDRGEEAFLLKVKFF